LPSLAPALPGWPSPSCCAGKGLASTCSRQDRVEHIVKASRRIGSQKQVKGRVALFLRDLMLPFFIRFGSGTTRAMTRYRADLTPLDKPSV
jgi:hypothetical protein